MHLLGRRHSADPDPNATPMNLRVPNEITDCRGVPDGRPCAHSPCGDGQCFAGLCVGECTPSQTPTVLTPTPTALATCVPTLGVISYCATHCEPCPTIRAGCNAEACRDCIENPVCAPDEICVPPGHFPNPGCCSCATATASVATPTSTVTPATGPTEAGIVIGSAQGMRAQVVAVDVTLEHSSNGRLGLQRDSFRPGDPDDDG